MQQQKIAVYNFPHNMQFFYAHNVAYQGTKFITFFT